MKIASYNQAFFRNVENTFLLLREWEGEEYALRFVTAMFSRGLEQAYKAVNAKRRGGQPEFKRCVGSRDAALGLNVSFEDTPTGFVYRFHNDPFPGLKGQVKPEKFDATYMTFKKNFFLGPFWKYSTAQHFWLGGEANEYVFSRL